MFQVVGLVAVAVKIRGLDPNGTTEDQLRQIKSEADQAWMKANESTAGVEQVRTNVPGSSTLTGWCRR